MRFDPALTECEKAMRAEQRSIDTARAQLRAPAQEIVPAEFDRLTLPIFLYLKPISSKPAKKEPPAPSTSEANGNERPDPLNVPDPLGESAAKPGSRPAASAGPPGDREPSEQSAPPKVDRRRERELAEADEDPEEIRKLRPPSFIVPTVKDKDRPPDPGGYSVIPEPNVFLLWAVGLVVVLIGANEFRRRQSKPRRR